MHPRDFDHIEHVVPKLSRYVLEMLCPLASPESCLRQWSEADTPAYADLEEAQSKCDYLNSVKDIIVGWYRGPTFFRIWDCVEKRIVYPEVPKEE